MLKHKRDKAPCARPVRTSALSVRAHSRRPIRRAADDFDLGLNPIGGSSHSDASVEEARRITFVFGRSNLAVHRYEQLFGYAPVNDLRALRARGAIIVMVPAIPDWLCSDAAARRRGGALSETEKSQVVREHGPGTGTAAVYDPQTDSLVLPTRDVSPDPLHPVLHELGHALTLDQVWKHFQDFRRLLDNLPQRIQEHLAGGYPEGNDDGSIRIRLAETFAEAYAMGLAGRDDELPADLASALIGILADMGQQGRGTSLRGSINPETGRTATFVPQEAMVREDSPGDPGATDPRLPPLTRAGDHRLLERRGRPWPPIER